MVDEAHRLNEKSGLYGNLGDNQIKEIIAAAKCVVFLLDEDQVVTLSDIGRKDEIRRWAQQQGAGVQEGTLASQFRCNGSDGYLAGLDDTLQIRKIANDKLDTREFDFKVIRSPEEVRRAIRDANKLNNKARMVAGYCWPWDSKRNPAAMDVVIREYWIAAPLAVASYEVWSDLTQLIGGKVV